MPCCHCIVCPALRVPRAAGGFAGRLERRARTTGGERGRHGKDRRRETTADPLIEAVPVRHRVLLRHGRDGRGARRVAPADRHRVDELPGHRRVSCMPTFVTIPAGGHVRDVPDLLRTASGTRARVFPRRPRPDRNLWRHAWSGGVVVSTRLEKSRKRGNPTWKPVMASGPRQQPIRSRGMRGREHAS